MTVKNGSVVFDIAIIYFLLSLGYLDHFLTSSISTISTLFRPYFDPEFSISVSCIVLSGYIFEPFRSRVVLSRVVSNCGNLKLFSLTFFTFFRFVKTSWVLKGYKMAVTNVYVS